MGDTTSNFTERYVGDNDPMKFAISDAGVLRADLADADSIDIKFIANGGSTLFSGPGTAIVPPEDDTWNCAYDFASGDTDGPANPNTYITVINGGTTATYGPVTLEIKDLT